MKPINKPFPNSINGDSGILTDNESHNSSSVPVQPLHKGSIEYKDNTNSSQYLASCSDIESEPNISSIQQARRLLRRTTSECNDVSKSQTSF